MIKFLSALGICLIIWIVALSLWYTPFSEAIPKLTKSVTSIAIIWAIWNVGYFFRCWGKSKLR